MCGTCSVGRELLSEIAESSQCVELVLLESLLSEIAEFSVWNLFCCREFAE